MTASRDSYVTVLELGAPVSAVHGAVMQPEAWLPAWPHVRSLERLADGGPTGIGRRHRATVRAVAPYTLTWEMEVVRADPDAVGWTARGDLEGHGCWRFRPDGSGTGTQIVSSWTVRPTPRWMAVLWPLARPLFLRNHDALMRRGARHLADHLDAELVRCVPRAG